MGCDEKTKGRAIKYASNCTPSSVGFGTLRLAIAILAETLGRDHFPATVGAGGGSSPVFENSYWQAVQSIAPQFCGQAGAGLLGSLRGVVWRVRAMTS